MLSRCQICSTELPARPLLALGALPSVNDLGRSSEPLGHVNSFPLEFFVCPSCTLGQINLVVDPKVVFPPSYPYVSGSTRILRDNFADLAQLAAGLLPSNEMGPRAIDIGSNDGTLLAALAQVGFDVVGVEPTDAANLANEAGLLTVKEFFSEDCAEKIVSEYGKFRLVTAANVFAHMPDPHSLMRGIDSLLDEDGVFISESHYLVDLIAGHQYDTIYHEHLRYYTVRSLVRLFGMHGFQIFDVQKIPTHGGSIRVLACRSGEREQCDALDGFLDSEKLIGLDKPSTGHRFRDSVISSKASLLEMLVNLRSANEHMKLVGIGAPSRASTLINYCGIFEDQLLAVAEATSSPKVGLCIPGTRIPVLADPEALAMQPTHALLLSWHIADELIDVWRKLGFGGHFIVPLPTPRIVS